MKKTVFFVIICLLLSLTACANRDASSIDGDADNGQTTTTSASTHSAHQDVIYFNKGVVSATVGRRLVDPVEVSESAFRAQYDVDFSVWKNEDIDRIKYILNYELDTETNKPDLSKLSDGRVSVISDDKVVLYAYISKTGYLREHIFETSDQKASQISDRDVWLFSLSNHLQSWKYSEFTIGDYYISYSALVGTEEDMVLSIKALLDNV